MFRNAVLLCLGVAIAGACSRASEEREDAELAATTPAPSPDPMVHVMLAPTEGNVAAGMLMVTERGDGVSITGSITGLKPATEMAVHVHERGDCSAPDGSSAGEHFNPTAEAHGNPATSPHHAGDMPNLSVDKDGVALLDFVIANTSLSGPAERNLANRAVVVHVMADDYRTQPSGNSGARVACGVIPPLASQSTSTR